MATGTVNADNPDPEAFLGTWSLRIDSYERVLVDRTQSRARAWREQMADSLSAEEREELEQALADRELQARERARGRALTFSLRADGSFDMETSWEGGDEPRSYSGQWLTTPGGFVLIDTRVEVPDVADAEHETSAALNWTLVFEGEAPRVVLTGGQIGLFGGDGIAFEHTGGAEDGQVRVMHASAPTAESPWVGSWLLDSEAKAAELESAFERSYGRARESARQRLRGPGDADGDGNEPVELREKQRAADERDEEKLKGAARELRTGARGYFRDLREAIVSLRLRPDGMFEMTRRQAAEGAEQDVSASGTWLTWDDHVLLIAGASGEPVGGDEGPVPAAPPENGPRDAAVLTRVSADQIEQVAGILPLVRFQPASSLVRIDE